MCQSTDASMGNGRRKGRETLPTIIFGSYDTHNRRNVGLESALRGVMQENMEIGIYRETKVTGEKCTQEFEGHRFIEADVKIPHRGGITVFYREAEQFALEALHLHGPNEFSFQMVSGGQRWNIVGCYITPDGALTIEIIIMAVR